ncbi:hypothetical protein, partial [Rectinema subterraneum]
MRKKKALGRLLAAFFLVMCASIAFAQPQEPTLADLPSILDHMLDNHYMPSAQVGLGSFTYTDTQLPTPFARWFEDELRLAFAKTAK